MSDLRRWSEEDATAEEISLLDVARRRRAHPAQRAAVLSALGVGVTTTAAGAASATGLVSKLVGLALLGTVGAGVGVAFWHPGTKEHVAAPPERAAAAPSVASRTSVVSPVASPEPSAVIAEVADTPAEPAAKTVTKPKASSAPSSSLSRELQVLKQAHDAIARGNPNGALAALDDYHARFPQGALGAEETVIRVQALLARGDRARAAAVAQQFSKTHPDSLYARRVEELVSGVH